MAQPPKYTKGQDFTEYATENPSAPYHPAKLDAELNKIATSIAALVENIVKIQRDDGKLGYGVITPDALSSSVLVMLGESGFVPRGAWASGVSYKAKEILDTGAGGYLVYVVSDHISTTVAADIASNKLMRVSRLIEQVASTVSIAGISGLSALDVQGALTEIVASVNSVNADVAEQLVLIGALTTRMEAAESSIQGILDSGGGAGGGGIYVPQMRFAFLSQSTPSIMGNMAIPQSFGINQVAGDLLESIAGGIVFTGHDRDSMYAQTGVWLHFRIFARYTRNSTSQFINNKGCHIWLIKNSDDKFPNSETVGQVDADCYRTLYRRSERISNSTSNYINIEIEYVVRAFENDTFSFGVTNLENFEGSSLTGTVVVSQLSLAYPPP